MERLNAEESTIQNLQVNHSLLLSYLILLHSCDCEGKAWERNNRCQSREELWRRYAQRRTVKDVDKNPQWAAVLDEYAVLHRTCMHQVGNVSEAFVSKSSSGCKFLVVDIHEVGLGNKVVLLSSAVLYAILTQRVILVPEYSYIPQIMCEPFLGSSWILDKSFPLPGPGWENTFLGKFFGWESSSWKSNIFFEKGKKLKLFSFPLHFLALWMGYGTSLDNTEEEFFGA